MNIDQVREIQKQALASAELKIGNDRLPSLTIAVLCELALQLREIDHSLNAISSAVDEVGA
jgi:hypothetical protein